MYVLIVTCVLNIILDLLFVVAFDMGVTGVAVATVTSQVISALIVTVMLLKTREIYVLKINQIRFDRRMLFSVLRIGIPAGLESVMYNISNIVIQVFVNNLGTDTVAAWGTLGKIDAIFWMVINAFAISITTFVGQNLGAKQYDRAKKGAKFGILCSISIAELIGITIYTAAPVLSAAFNRDPDVIQYGVMQARTIALFYCLLAFTHCIAAVLRGSGNAAVPMIVLLCVWCLFRVSYITLAVRLIPDIRVIFWAYPLTWSISSVIFLFLFLRGNWVHGFEKKVTGR